MDKPNLNDYIFPVLNAFKSTEKLGYSQIVDSISDNFDFIQNDTPKRSLLLINGSLGYLLKALVLERVEYKVFSITVRGKELLKENIEIIDVKLLRKYPEFEEFISGRYKKANESIGESNDSETEILLPEEKINSAYEIYRNNLISELLEKLSNCSWKFFELLVQDLMVSMGYGDPFDEARVTYGSGDGGIDGIIKADVLGLDIVCLQAKKWENSVGRPDIQKFAGSLESKRAKKGVFITTSSFTKEAIDYINQIEKKIVLIDGNKLAEFMIDYNVGVSDYKKITLKKLDSDYFEGN